MDITKLKISKKKQKLNSISLIACWTVSFSFFPSHPDVCLDSIRRRFQSSMVFFCVSSESGDIKTALVLYCVDPQA